MATLDHLSPEERRRIRDLSEQFVKFPLSVATPIFFGDFSVAAQDAEINNGTGTLLQLGPKRFCITNRHVIEAYRKRVRDGGRITFQIGNIGVDPEILLVSESSQYDLAVLDIGAYDLTELASDGDVPTRFIEALDWPPSRPEPGQFVMFGGYPGYWREPTGPRAVRFDTASSGATEVHASRFDKIVCRLELEKCITHSYVPQREKPGPLTGLSGGPVLMERKSPAGISTFELVGIIYEYNESFDVLYARPLSLMSALGIIQDY